MTSPARLSFGQTLRYLGESAFVFPLILIFKLIGIDAASALGGFIGQHVFKHLPVANTARKNLKAAYPDKSDAEIEAIVCSVCENLGRVVAEYPHLDKMMLGPGERIEIEGTEYAEAAIARGKGVMFISGHFANWEVMPIAAAHLGYEGGLVYRPPNNPYVDRWIAKQRAKLGPKEQITKSAQGTRRIFTLLRRGRSIFMLVDQKTYQGVPSPFFGRDAMTTQAPASLALKLGSVLLPASCERVKGAYFHMKIYPPVEYEPTGDSKRDEQALTNKITAEIEKIVRQRPSQWLWIHRRWFIPKDLQAKLKAQEAEGSGVRVEREGSSLT